MKPLALAVAAVILAAVGAEATVIVPTDLGELSRDAFAIVRGTVVAVDARWTTAERTAIETIVTLESDASLKGSLGPIVRFRVPGGRLGRYRSITIGAPQFLPGQRVIVFLGASPPSLPFVVGFSQGVFRIVPDAGGWVVTPPPILPVAGPIVRGDGSRRPMKLADFERKVHELAGGAQ